MTYLYNEASAADAQDFAAHLETCAACRAEFAVFSQVHESILLWRNEGLGVGFIPAAQAAPVLAEALTDSNQFVRHERKLPALAALREFFSVSPLWLRGATAFAALLLCVLAVVTISRLSQRQPHLAGNETEPRYSKQDVEQARQEGLDEGMARANSENGSRKGATTATVKSKESENRVPLTANQWRPRTSRPRGLSRAERVQLAADLRLTPAMDDEELPFVFPNEPNR